MVKICVFCRLLRNFVNFRTVVLEPESMKQQGSGERLVGTKQLKTATLHHKNKPPMSNNDDNIDFMGGNGIKMRVTRGDYVVRSENRWFSKLTFYSCYTLWIFTWSLFGAGLLAWSNDLPYLDGLFMATSAITSTGLSTVSMSDLTTPSFALLVMLIVFGSSLLLPLGPMWYRRYKYKQIKASFPTGVDLSENSVVQEFDLQDRALGVMIRWVLIYVTLWIVIGAAMLLCALHLRPNEPALQEAGISRFANAIFLSVSSFNNAGFSLSPNSVEYLHDNPLAYLILSMLIIAGNTMSPVFYRFIIWAEWRLRIRLHWDTSVHRFILDNPRRISTNTLPTREVIFLFITTTALNIMQYVFYLASSLGKTSLINSYGDTTVLAGMGFFQTISTRNAGLQIMNLRTMNQGMLLVYGIAMYLSGAPFLTALYSSEDSQENEARQETHDSDAYSDTDSDCSDYDYYTDSEEEAELQSMIKGDEELENADKESIYSSDSDEGEPRMKIKRTNTDTSTLVTMERVVIDTTGIIERANDNENSMLYDDRDGSGINNYDYTSHLSVESAASLKTEELSGGEETTTSTQLPSGSGVRRKFSIDALFSRGKIGIDTESSEANINTQSSATNVAKNKISRRKMSFRSGNQQDTSTPRQLASGLQKSVARFRRLVKESLFLSPSTRSGGTLHTSDPDVATRYARHRVMNRNDVDVSQLLLARSEAASESKECITVSGCSAVITKKAGLHHRKSFSGLGEFTDERRKDRILSKNSEVGQQPGVEYLEKNRSGAKELRAVSTKRKLSTAQLVADHNIGTGQQFLPGRVHRANSVDILNQKKFEIQQKFLENFIMKHSFFIGVGVFICAFSEDNFMAEFPEKINLWYIIFEVMSAYGNVGLSLGEPGESFSLVGSFGFIGKLTICAIMILGKHRSQPKERDAVIDFKFKRLRRVLHEIPRPGNNKFPSAYTSLKRMETGDPRKVMPLTNSALKMKESSGTSGEGGDDGGGGRVPLGRRISFSSDMEQMPKMPTSHQQQLSIVQN